MDITEKLTNQVLKDGEFIAEQVKQEMIEDKIGVMLLSGYKVKIWLERNGNEAKIRSEVELKEGEKGMTFEQFFGGKK